MMLILWSKWMRENISHWEQNIPFEMCVMGIAGYWEKPVLHGAGPVYVHITPGDVGRTAIIYLINGV